MHWGLGGVKDKGRPPRSVTYAGTTTTTSSRGRRSVAYGTERIRGGFHRIPASRVALMIDPIYPVPERFGKIKPTIVVPPTASPPRSSLLLSLLGCFALFSNLFARVRLELAPLSLLLSGFVGDTMNIALPRASRCAVGPPPPRRVHVTRPFASRKYPVPDHSGQNKPIFDADTHLPRDVTLHDAR